jgi:hypothetical protein
MLALGAMSVESPDTELLAHFQPVVRYDSSETFFADAVEIMAGANDAFQLTRGDNALIAPAPVSAALLAASAYTNGRPVEPGDRLGATRRDYREQAYELHPHPDLRNVVYGHVARDSGGRVWLQYWYFYLYNDASFAGNIGLHEGDWEMVQLRMAGEQPDLAVYAQHDYCEQREWSQVEREGPAPVVYPGRGTHASYFEPGLHRTAVWWDIVDGLRPAPPLRLVVLDDQPPGWVAWPGRWGATQPRIPAIDSWSPVGPAQHEQWSDPGKLLAKARGHERREPPPAPSVRVRRRLGRLALAFDLEAPPEGLDRPDRLVVTVNSPDEQAPPSTYTFTIDNALRGRLLSTRELDPLCGYDVHTSIVDVTGKASAGSRCELPRLGAIARALALACSLLHDIRLALGRRWHG